MTGLARRFKTFGTTKDKEKFLAPGTVKVLSSINFTLVPKHPAQCWLAGSPRPGAFQRPTPRQTKVLRSTGIGAPMA
jgi:hypothetical protein